LEDLEFDSKSKKEAPIRYAIGIMTYSYARTNEKLIHGIQTDNGVIIIHKDDFKRIMENTVGFHDFKKSVHSKIDNMRDILDAWK